jgi:hypothetical protein
LRPGSLRNHLGRITADLAQSSPVERNHEVLRVAVVELPQPHQHIASGCRVASTRQQVLAAGVAAPALMGGQIVYHLRACQKQKSRLASGTAQNFVAPLNLAFSQRKTAPNFRFSVSPPVTDSEPSTAQRHHLSHDRVTIVLFPSTERSPCPALHASPLQTRLDSNNTYHRSFSDPEKHSDHP